MYISSVLNSYRLFELGFAEQLHEILRRLPESKQTLFLSATLPKMLVEFTKAGLKDPVLVRLDVDSKLSDQLKVGHRTVEAVYVYKCTYTNTHMKFPYCNLQ